jgi:hypothetical protein
MRWDVIEPVTSFAIRRDGRLVGWIISERKLEPDGSSINYAAAYLDETLWHTGLMFAACCHAIGRQAAEFGRTSLAKFETPEVLPGTIAVIRRRLAPLALSIDEIYVTRKLLEQSRHG